MVWALLNQTPQVHALRSSEYQLKAVFLFNFAKFIEWPGTDASEVLGLGILGDDPFGDALDTIEGQRVGGRRLKVVRSARPQDLEACHILFVCPSEQDRLNRILSHFRGRDVLLVGDVEGFARQGGMINFYRHGSKVRFEINVDALERTSLRVSAKLLKLARLVRNGG